MQASKSKQKQVTRANPVEYAINYLNISITRYQYRLHLTQFFKFLQLPGQTIEEQGQAFIERSYSNPSWTQESVMQFLNHHKDRAVNKKEISSSTLTTLKAPIKLFCEMNDIGHYVNWRRITKALPKPRMSANDRAPTTEELQQLIRYEDRRIRAIVLTMASSGIRIGAWDYLKWKHVIPVEREGVLVAAKLIVYAGDAEEYTAYCTPEAYFALKEWLDYRAANGEKVTPESWLMRDIWRTADVINTDQVGGRYGLAGYPQKLHSDGIKKIISRALYRQGVRHSLAEGNRRHEWKAAHGLRKFFKTQAHRAMRDLFTELLMGHSLGGVRDSYLKPTEDEILEEYLKAVPLLTIDDKNAIAIGNNNSALITGPADPNRTIEQALKEQLESITKYHDEIKRARDSVMQRVQEYNKELKMSRKRMSRR